MKVAIISHTEHYKKNSGELVGWGPTVNEINHLVISVDAIVHIAPLHPTAAPNSALSYNSDKVSFVPLMPSGGQGIKKLSILWNSFYNLQQISNAIKNVDIIQFRAPTGIGSYVLPYLKFFNSKKYWVKYAGNWKDDNMPFGNKFQKWWIKKIVAKTTKVTVNGKWPNEKKNVISFENPCLDQNDRFIGKELLTKKNLPNKINYCFVGALNDNKGVSKIIETFCSIESDKIGTIHIVGDGELMHALRENAIKAPHKIKFHGFLPKNEIHEIYSDSQFILVPSKREGFPKVVGEAMNYGCIPIVSNISCIDQYIIDTQNGYLLDEPTTSLLINKVKDSLQLSNFEFAQWVEYNYQLAEKFTYSYYNARIRNEIFK